MNTSRCPDLLALYRLLKKELEQDCEPEIVTHLATCNLCQDQLAVLTVKATGGGGPVIPEANETLDPEPAPGGDRDATSDFGRAAALEDTDQGATGDYTFGAKLPPANDAQVDRGHRDPLRTVTHSGSEHDVSVAGPRSNGERGWPTIPGYKLVSKLGEGGMGVVFLAEQTGLNRQVAVKMIRGGSQARPDHFSRFRVEAEAVAQLRHQNIVQIYEIGEVDGLPYFSLELLEGGSLDDRMAGTPQSPRQAAGLVATLARAVGVAHAAGIIHRDLKPSNVLYTLDGVPKVTDFGLAKRMESDSRQTESGAIMGSPSYMAPEQARGNTKDVRPAADIYALGAILYEMLTGRPPFKGVTPIDTVRQVIDDEAVPPSRLVPKVPRDLETICLKCLDKDPLKRYTAAAAFVEDLERFQKGETILARRTPPLERGYKWAKRRPARAAMIVFATAGFLILTLGGAWYERQRRLLETAMARAALERLDKGSALIDAARAAHSAEDLSRAQGDLSHFEGQLKSGDQQRIAGLPERIQTSLDDVHRRLRELRDSDSRQKLDLAERRRFEKFKSLRSRAQLAAVEFELDPASRGARLRDAAHQALAVYARDSRAADQDWTIADQLPGVLSPGDKGLITEGSYDLLLLLSQSVEPAAGLKILDRASRLRPESTAAYHLRRADCLARLGDKAGQKDEEARAAHRPPKSALDHLLIGREQMAQRQWTQAIGSLDTALHDDPDQLAVRLLLAICDYNVDPKRLGEARDHLNACLRSQPDLVELYLLRARVHGEEGNQALARSVAARPEERQVLRRQAEGAFKAALSDYSVALERLPSDDFRYVLLVNRGGMYLQAGRTAESLVDLEAAVALRPELYQGHATLGQLQQRRGLLELASAAFGRAIDRAQDPAARVALLRTRALLHANRRDANSAQRTAALSDLDQALRLEPIDGQERAGDLVERARILFGLARYDETLTACGAALALTPDLADAHQLQISALMALKRFDDVLGSCDAYLAGGKPTVEILEIRGLARVARRNQSGAIADYTRALELRRDLDLATRSRLLNHRGWAFQFADAPRLALDDFEDSLALVKDQSDAHCGRGLARVRLGDWRRAVVDAEAAVRLALLSPPQNGGLDDQVQADFNAARIYAQAIEFAARDVGRDGERAVTLYRTYRSRAVELLQKTLRRVPDPARRKEILSDPALKPLRFAGTGLADQAPIGNFR
jgi:tetratricopeptide (TPR) repeat protein